MEGDQCQNYTAMAFTKLKHAHFLFVCAFFIWVWSFYLGIVFILVWYFLFGYGGFHLGMLLAFGYGLLYLDMVFSFGYAPWIWIQIM